jgi:hypothetical protein
VGHRTVPFLYPKIINRPLGCNHRPINFREMALPIGVNLRFKPIINVA